MKFKCVRLDCKSCSYKMLCDDSPHYGVEIPDDYILVSWANRYNEGDEIINAPITMNGKCVGVVTGVSKEYLYGKVFAKAVPKFRLDDYKCVSFEMVGGN